MNSLEDVEEVLSLVGSLAVKGSVLVGELPVWLVDTPTGNKVSLSHSRSLCLSLEIYMYLFLNLFISLYSHMPLNIFITVSKSSFLSLSLYICLLSLYIYLSPSTIPIFSRPFNFRFPYIIICTHLFSQSFPPLFSASQTSH